MESKAGTKPVLAAVNYRRGHGLAVGGLAVAAVVLASLAAAAWWADRSNAQSLREARTREVTAVCDTLAASAEVMLASDDLSAARRVVMNTAMSANLVRCRIVLPDGQIVADAKPGQITCRQLPKSWLGHVSQDGLAVSGRPVDRTSSSDIAGVFNGSGGRLTRAYTLHVANRGQASLEIEAWLDGPVEADSPVQAGIWAIGAGALLVLLVLHGLLNGRAKALLAIRRALLARSSGLTDPVALEVCEKWGPEAAAWNDLLRNRRQERREAILGQIKDSFKSGGNYSNDLDAACDAMSQGLILVDKDLCAKYANGAAAALLRVKREDLFAHAATEVISDQRIIQAMQSATSGPMLRRTVVELEQPTAEGVSLLRFIVRPVRREDSAVAMVIIEDITQQRVAEESRNTFVAQATHELRTPLTNIRLYAEMAMEDGKDSPTDRARCMNVVNQEVRRLDRMVADILSVAEMESGKLKLKRDDVRLEELLKELQEDFVPAAAEKQIELAFHMPPKLPVIQGDRNKIVLGLHNLVGNALKYTPAGGKVSVTILLDGGRILIDVSDTGFGIKTEEADRIFEKFYRSRDRRVTEITGSGLGLAIAREVIRLHGGDITVQSELDKGSTFTMTLPTSAEAA